MSVVDDTKKVCEVVLSLPLGQNGDTRNLEKTLFALSKKTNQISYEEAKKYLDEESIEELRWICEVYDIALV